MPSLWEAPTASSIALKGSMCQSEFWLRGGEKEQGMPPDICFYL